METHTSGNRTDFVVKDDEMKPWREVMNPKWSRAMMQQTRRGECRRDGSWGPEGVDGMRWLRQANLGNGSGENEKKPKQNRRSTCRGEKKLEKRFSENSSWSVLSKTAMRG